MDGMVATLQRPALMRYPVEPLWRCQDLKALLPVGPESDAPGAEAERAEHSTVLVACDELIGKAAELRLDRSLSLWSID